MRKYQTKILIVGIIILLTIIPILISERQFNKPTIISGESGTVEVRSNELLQLGISYENVIVGDFGESKSERIQRAKRNFIRNVFRECASKYTIVESDQIAKCVTSKLKLDNFTIFLYKHRIIYD